VYQRLLKHFGPQHWWPGEGPFEVIVGAILTQSTAWTNVEKGIANLKKAGALSPQTLRGLPSSELAELIHSCGYFNAKAAKLKAFADWFGRLFDDSLEKMFAGDTGPLREELLKVHGIGEETADSILLYAGNKTAFVVDAYTRRIVDRLGLKIEGSKYSDYQKLFKDNLPQDVRLFNEYHALLVALGKNYCRKSNPLCEECCLREFCQRKIRLPKIKKLI
jgi:endonuclease III related protein